MAMSRIRSFQSWQVRGVFAGSGIIFFWSSVALALLVVLAMAFTQLYVYISACQQRPGHIGSCLSGPGKEVALWYWFGHTDQQLDRDTNGIPEVSWQGHLLSYQTQTGH